MKPIRPFLKWAGAKTRLLPAIRAAVPKVARRLIEPFVGSGVVGLNLGFPENVLADSNADLMAVYSFLQHEGTGFIDACAALFAPASNCAAVYYGHRAEFNTTPDPRRKACLFVYLNRHGYNGLCRYNRGGGFNVPFGRYTHPRLLRERMQAFYAFLQRCVLRGADFRSVIEEAGAGDFVYCDPPYVPASATANFTKYARRSFTPGDQADLATCCRAAAHRGACVALSNHDTPQTRALYADADEVHELLVPRRISCHSDTRVRVRELLVVFRPIVLPAVTTPPCAEAAAPPIVPASGSTAAAPLRAVSLPLRYV